MWFTGSNEIGRFIAMGVVSSTSLSGEGNCDCDRYERHLWVTEIFADLIGRLTPGTTGAHQLQEFPTAANAAPLGIAAADDGIVRSTLITSAATSLG